MVALQLIILQGALWGTAWRLGKRSRKPGRGVAS